ncbi:rod shape-determining protein MreD [Hyphomicrobium sp. 99]|uniref:rod shape-determining protein MreD n=1 Tax=Hyphomicrobium sp. 99 TaxID=1163419 RepID=UPI0005F82D21|nr:rod shape-determining protein MreD [Hyphomicrobium sp. 99]
MMWLRFLMPVISVVVLTLAAALPWGLAAEDRFVLPLLPVIAIYEWTRDPDAWLPEWVIFIAGLTLDVLTQGPLGYWALVYLFAYVVALIASRTSAETVIGRMALIAFAIIAVTGFSWILASLYFLQLLDWQPYARSALITMLAALVLVPLLGILRFGSRTSRGIRLTRGSG